MGIWRATLSDAHTVVLDGRMSTVGRPAPVV
jgi:hypothetical protein